MHCQVGTWQLRTSRPPRTSRCFQAPGELRAATVQSKQQKSYFKQSSSPFGFHFQVGTRIVLYSLQLSPLFFWKVSAERTPGQREWRPQIYRKCTDPQWLFLFFFFWTGLVSVGARECVSISAPNENRILRAAPGKSRLLGGTRGKLVLQ